MYVQVDVSHRAIIESDDGSETCSVSIVVSIPACHVGDLGSIPRRSGRKVISATRDRRVVTIATLFCWSFLIDWLSSFLIVSSLGFVSVCVTFVIFFNVF